MINSNINEIQDLDFNITEQPYIVKKYAKDWFAFNNWSFNFLKTLDVNKNLSRFPPSNISNIILFVSDSIGL